MVIPEPMLFSKPLITEKLFRIQPNFGPFEFLYVFLK